jgi:hypothetical protein
MTGIAAGSDEALRGNKPIRRTGDTDRKNKLPVGGGI